MISCQVFSKLIMQVDTYNNMHNASYLENNLFIKTGYNQSVSA